MLPKISKIAELKQNISTVLLFDEIDQLPKEILNEKELNYLSQKLEDENTCTVYKHPQVLFFGKVKKEKDINVGNETTRKAGAVFFDLVKKEKTESLQVTSFCIGDSILPFLEGLLLSAYSFSKYKKKKDDYSPAQIFICDDKTTKKQLNELKAVTKAVFHARDLVNEPLSFLTAMKLAEEIEKLGKEAGFSVEVLNKNKIEALKMGGLLAVNKGSIDPPTFTILEWKPDNAKNKKPVVFVGKGVVYDTGGLSLKTTPKSMDYMKCDMAGAAVVASTIYAAAKNKLPVHLIGLVPATDNRPDGNAYAPGDIITMFDRTTVEIKNTDAEGRLLLADALSYAKKYTPELVIDLATLTGSAEIITGPHGAIGMGNSPDSLAQLKKTGEETYERIVEVPLWEEFAEALKSPIADLNNLGAREGQTSIAGKFLEHFTGYNWLHIDIAGVSFLQKKIAYRPEGATGFGTRLLFNFLKKYN